MRSNPYQSPQSSTYLKPDLKKLPVPRVEGDLLVVGPETVLPPYCVKTNLPVTERDAVHQVYFSPLYVKLLVFLMGEWVFLVYLVARRKCEVKFGLLSSQRAKYRKRRTLIIAAIPTLIFMPLLGILALDPELGPIPPVIPLSIFILATILRLAAMLSMFFIAGPLRAVQRKEGQFWFKGCCPEFLQRNAKGGSEPPLLN